MEYKNVSQKRIQIESNNEWITDVQLRDEVLSPARLKYRDGSHTHKSTVSTQPVEKTAGSRVTLRACESLKS